MAAQDKLLKDSQAELAAKETSVKEAVVAIQTRLDAVSEVEGELKAALIQVWKLAERVKKPPEKGETSEVKK